jgi:hypothetical protein
MAEPRPKPKPSRLTLAPLYLAAGLVVCYLVLTRMVPTMSSIVDERVAGRPQELSGWLGVSVRLSAVVREHATTCIVLFSVVAAAGFVLPALWRPTKYLVWAAAIAIFLFDVALAAGGYWQMIGKLIDETNQVGR